MRKSIKKLIALTIATTTILATSAIGASAEWKSDNVGWWNTEGDSYSTGWRLLDNKWYYFSSNGYMQTGWVQTLDNKWYYLNTDGAMLTNAVINGYTVGVDGAWIDTSKKVVANTSSNTTVATNKVITPVTNNVVNPATVNTTSSETSSSSHHSSSSNSSSSSSSSNDEYDVNAFTIYYRLSDLKIVASGTGNQNVYGEKAKIQGVIVLDSRDYNSNSREMAQIKWSDFYHVENINGKYTLVKNPSSSTTEPSTTKPAVSPLPTVTPVVIPTTTSSAVTIS